MNWNKYGAKKTEIDGIVFDSQKEAMRWCELMLMIRAGEICNLDRQVKIEIVPKTDKYRAMHYIADFRYYDKKTQRFVYEDVKGCRKGLAYQLFRLKKAIVYWRYGIDIQEV